MIEDSKYGVITDNNRSHLLDMLKTISITLIIFTHGTYSTTIRKHLGFIYWIDQAVPIFLIISGYLFTQSFINKNVNSFKKAYHPKILMCRLIRFIIPFLIAFIIQEAIIMMLIKQWDNRFFINLINGGVGPGSYYTAIMIQFVVVFPLIYFLIKKYGLSGLILMFVINVSYEILQYFIHMDVGIYRMLVFKYLFLIASGCYIWFYKIKIDIQNLI